MLFYRVQVGVKEFPEITEDEDRATMGYRGLRTRHCHRAAPTFQSATARYWENEDTFPFVSEVADDVVYIGVLCNKRIADSQVQHYLDVLKIAPRSITCREITFSSFNSLLDDAIAQGFLDRNHSERLLKKYQLDELSRCYSTISEEVVHRRDNEEHLVADAKALLSTSLAEEVHRIFQVGNTGGVVGHPVHYIIETDAKHFQHEAITILVSALAQMERVSASRVVMLEDLTERHSKHDQLAGYCAAKAGTIVVPMREDRQEEGRFARIEADAVQNVVELMRDNYDDVLTVFAVGKSCNELRTIVQRELGEATLVRITEDTADAASARIFLEARAQQLNLVVDELLFSNLQEGTVYTVSDLSRMFERWKKERLKTVVYPQYASLLSSSDELKEKEPKGSAYEKLQALTGLTEVKAKVSEILDFFKAQKIFADRGLAEYHPTMHMVFSGSPGTAKTTVARLIGQILKENGILSKGEMHEVGRSDLVGRYVGWTAQIVKNKFREARGGVLFIDEAYSLIDDRAGMYGDEAINTIVEEMENMREDIMVVFAGYQDRMEEFIARNPGLRSRIAAHIPFADYSAEELVAITHHEAGEMGLTLGDGVAEKIRPIYEKVRTIEDFGNGRYARNMVEQARMAQSVRLLRGDPGAVTEKIVHTLIANDFSEVAVEGGSTRRQIGFTV